MLLSDFRKQYPQYDETPDDELANALHQKHYSNIPIDDFYESIGLVDDTTLLGNIGEFGKRALGGVATGAVSTVTGLGQLIPGIDDETMIEADTSFREGVADTLGYDSAYDESYFPKLGGVIGEMVPMVASAFLPGGAAGTAARLATMTGPAVSEGGMDRARFEAETGDELSTYERLASKGADVALGQLERFGIPARIMKGLPKGFMKTDNVLAQRIQSMVASGLTEGVQEVGQGIARDLSTLAIYDENRAIGDSAVEDFTLGGGAGAFFDAVIGAVQMPMGGRKARAPKPIGEMTPEEVEIEQQKRDALDRTRYQQAAELTREQEPGPMPQAPVPVDPLATSLVNPDLSADEITNEVIKRLNEQDLVAPYTDGGEGGIPMTEPFVVSREDGGKFYVEQNGLQVGPLMSDPMKATDVMIALNKTSADLRKQADVEYAVDTMEFEDTPNIVMPKMIKNTTPKKDRIKGEGDFVVNPDFNNRRLRDEAYLQRGTSQPSRDRMIDFASAIPSPDERVITAEQAESAVPGITTKINKLRVKNNLPAITQDGSLSAFTLNEIRKANRGDIGNLGDVLAATPADQLAFRGRSGVAETRGGRPTPALGMNRPQQQQFKQTLASDISANNAFNQLFKNKNIATDVNSNEFRGLVKRILGKTPAKKNPLEGLNTSERQYLYHSIRALPSFQDQGQAPVAIPDFSVKTPDAEVTRRAKQLVRDGVAPVPAAEQAQYAATGQMPTRTETARVAGAVEGVQEADRAGDTIPADQQMVPFDLDQSALGQQLRDMLAAMGLEKDLSTRMVETVGRARRNLRGEVVVQPIEAVEQTTEDGKKTVTAGSADMMSYVIQVALDGIMVDVRNGMSYEQAVAQSMNHEMVHALRGLDLFTPEEFSLLERLSRTYKKQDGNITYGQWAATMYPNADAPLMQEEAIAEMLADALTGQTIIGNTVQKPSGKPASLLKKLVNFFKRLVGFAENNDVQSFNDLVAKMQSGEVGGRERGVVRTAVMTEKLAKADIPARSITAADLATETGQRRPRSAQELASRVGIQQDEKSKQDVSDAPEVADLDPAYSRKSDAGGRSSRDMFSGTDTDMFDRVTGKVDYDLRLKSRKIVVDMPIAMFEGLAASMDGTRPDSESNVREVAESGKTFDMIPTLSMTFKEGKPENRYIYDHDGRHRARQLQRMGYDTVPVMVQDASIRWDQQDEGNFDRVKVWPKNILSQDGDVAMPMFINRDAEVQYGQFSPAVLALDPMESRRAVGTPITKAIQKAKEKYVDVSISTEEEFFGTYWPKLLKEVGGTVAPNKLRVAAKRAVNDLKKWIKDNPKYNDYYAADMAAVKSALEGEYGPITDSELLLFQFLNGATSPGTLLNVNVGEAVRLFDIYKRNGNFDSFKLEPNEKGNLVIAKAPFVLSAATSPIKARILKSFDKVVRSEGSLDKAIKKLFEPVSMKELETFKKSLGYAGVAKKGEIKGLVEDATGQDKLIPRAFFMGPKLGAYTLNLMGDSRFQTIDVWEARFIRSYFDNMYDVNTGITANADEASLFRDFSKIFSEEFEKIVGYKTDPSSLQAMRWFYMINAARQAGYRGASTNETISEITAKKLQDTRGSRYGGRTASLEPTERRKSGDSDSRSGGANSPEYESTVQGAIRPDGKLSLTHYSNNRISRTDPARAGTATDRIKPNRPTFGTWFGITEANQDAYVREPMVGTVANNFAISPERLYVIADYKNQNAPQDPLGVWSQNPQGQPDYDAILSKAKAAGFDGILINAPQLGKVALINAPLESIDAMESRRPNELRPEQTGSGAGRIQAGRLTPLEGAPTINGATGPDPSLVSVAEAYAESNGIPLKRQSKYAEVDTGFAKQIADAYESMENNPANPEVVEAYQNLASQVKSQYEALIDDGYTFSFFDSNTDPYDGNPWNAMRDLRKNKKMAVYGTYDGYGTDGISPTEVEQNPMLASTGLFWPDQNGQPQEVTVNDLFRAVHDAFGHGLEGAGFRARGEENAWQAHSRLFTGSALSALTTETRGQNSWLNFGPHAATNQTAALEDTIFADQKIGLMPSWTWARQSEVTTKNTDTNTVERRAVATPQQKTQAVEENLAQIDTTFGPARFSVKASPEAQYIAQNPESGIKPVELPHMEQRKLAPGQQAAVDKLTKGLPQEKSNGKVFMEATGTGPIGEFLTRLKANAINRYAGLEKYYQKIPMLKELEADSSAIAAALFSDRAKGILASAVRYGVPVYRDGLTKVERFEYNGQRYGGLIDVMSIIHNKDVGDLRKLAQSYAMVRRAKVLAAQGKPTPVTPQDAKEIMAAVSQLPNDANGNNPVLEWHKVWTAYNSKTIDFLKATGILNNETADQWQDSSYVPFYREAQGERLPNAAKGVFGDLTRKSEFKQYKGSEKAVDVGLVEGITLNLSAAIEMGMKNVAQQRIARDMQAMGLARQIPNKQKGVNKITFNVDGKNVSFEIDDNLIFDSMETLSGGAATEVLQKVLGLPSNVLREMITRDPTFMLANGLRDTLSAFTTSGASFIPVVDTVKGVFSGMERLEKVGVIGGYDFSIDQQDINKFYNKEAKRRGIQGEPLNMFTRMWDGLGRATTLSDAATRNAVYDDVLARTGNEAEAAFQAMEVINFSRRGAHPIARVITAAIPFLNARFQGLDVFVRASAGNYSTVKSSPGATTAKFLIRGGMLAGLTALYWAMSSDEDWYEEQSEEVRDNNWLINIGEGLPPMKLPIPFEVGLLFKVIPETILATTYGDKSAREAFETVERGVVSTLEINPLGFQIIAPIAEAALNHSAFTGNPIVPYYMSKLEPYLQTNQGTTEIAKFAAKHLGISALKIDHVIKGYTGTLGGYIISLADAALKSEIVQGEDAVIPASRNIFEFPLWRRFFASKEGKGLQQDAYELYAEVETVVNSLNRLKQEGREDEFISYAQSRQNLLSLKGDVYAVKKQLDQARKAKIQINNSNLDPDVKRQMIDDIDAKINEYLTVMPKLKAAADLPAIKMFQN